MPTYDSPYTAPTLVVDSVIFQYNKRDDKTDDRGRLSVLLIKRGAEPFKDTWALPGAYCAAGETTTDAMARSLRAKAGVDSSNLGFIEQLFTFDTVARDPRGHAVSVSYMGVGRDLVPLESGDTQYPGFFAVDELPALAYDHKDIIAYAHERLKSKLSYTTAAFAFLPPYFTLTQLQTVYETVFGTLLDKRNFRKKFMAYGVIDETDEMQQGGAHRPARLYAFNHQKLERLENTLGGF